MWVARGKGFGVVFGRASSREHTTVQIVEKKAPSAPCIEHKETIETRIVTEEELEKTWKIVKKKIFFLNYLGSRIEKTCFCASRIFVLEFCVSQAITSCKTSLKVVSANVFRLCVPPFFASALFTQVKIPYFTWRVTIFLARWNLRGFRNCNTVVRSYRRYFTKSCLVNKL